MHFFANFSRFAEALLGLFSMEFPGSLSFGGRYHIKSPYNQPLIFETFGSFLEFCLFLVVQNSKTKAVDFEFWLAGWHLYKETAFFWEGKGLLDLDLLGPVLDLGS